MAVLAALMISDVPYPTMPSIGFKSIRKIFGTVVIFGCIFLLLTRKEEFIFPAMLAYVLYGAVKWVALGFLGKSATPDEVYGAGDRPHGAQRGERRPTPARGTPAGAMLGADARRDDNRDEKLERRPDEAPTGIRRRRRRRGHRGGQRPQGSNPPGPPLPDSPTGPAE
jgi:hypothetical protein